MPTPRNIAVVTAFLLTIIAFISLTLNTPIPQNSKSGNQEGMAIRLLSDKAQYYVDESINLTIEYHNINAYPVDFKPPSVYDILYEYGESGITPEWYSGRISGSTSPPSNVGRVYEVKGRGVYTLFTVEFVAERVGILYLNYLGVVRVLRISDNPPG